MSEHDAMERAMRAEAWLDELDEAAGFGSVAAVAAHQRSLGVEGDHETRHRKLRVAKLKATVMEEDEWRRQVLHEWQERAEAAEAERDRLRAAVDAALAQCDRFDSMYAPHGLNSAVGATTHAVRRALTTEEDQ